MSFVSILFQLWLYLSYSYPESDSDVITLSLKGGTVGKRKREKLWWGKVVMPIIIIGPCHLHLKFFTFDRRRLAPQKRRLKNRRTTEVVLNIIGVKFSVSKVLS
jgi:hypothetical protein